MKHVLLIVAHSQFESLNKLISQFDNEPDFQIYIHIDLKSDVTDEILQLLNRHVSVKNIVCKYNINWGGRNLFRAMLYLCNIIIDDLSNEEFYVHTLSGVDILTRSISEFKAFFDSNKGRNFMENFSLPYHGWNNGGLDRLELYHPLDRWNIRCENGAKLYKRYIEKQKNKNVKRLLPQIQLYGGGCWWSITNDATEYLCKFYNDNGLFDRMYNTFGPEEILPQTILMNSDFKDTIVNSSLRYICWDYGTRGTPSIIEPYDIPYIQLSHSFFARKIDYITSSEVSSFFSNLHDSGILNLDGLGEEERVHAIAGYIMENMPRCNLLGLMSGLSGACVFLFCYARAFDNVYAKTLAQNLIADIIEKRKNVKTCDFNNGTIGIAFTMTWLKKHDFISNKVDEILHDFDIGVMEAVDYYMRENYMDEFYKKYFRFDAYLSERKIQLSEETWNFISYFSPPLSSFLSNLDIYNEKCSIGLLGYAGYGLLLLEKQLPSGMLSSILNL